MKILRIGGVNPNTSRFLDLLDNEAVSHIDFFVPYNEKEYFNDIEYTSNFLDKNELLKKFDKYFYKESMFLRGIRKLGRKWSSRFLMYLAYYPLWKFQKNYDFVWIGDNDFDGSNSIFIAARYFFKKSIIIRSYKETRFIEKWEEKIMLMESDFLIFPHASYLEFFNRLYNFTPQNYSIADLDWRYSQLVNWVAAQKVTKLSVYDHKPHVCILTGRALSDPTELRSGYRYYFVPIIRELIQQGIVVHLHAQRIFPDGQDNEYSRIQEETGMLYIENALDLKIGSGDYLLLKRYDAGILHPTIPEKSKELAEFQKINIPNRIFEYFLAGVYPIAERNATPAAEDIIKEAKFGIIYDSFKDLEENLFRIITGKIHTQGPVFKKSYKDFSDTLLDSVKKMQAGSK